LSIKSMIEKAGIKCKILYLSSVVGAGAQLTKTWLVRYNNVPIRFNPKPKVNEALYFDTQKAFPVTVAYIMYKPGIIKRDRVKFGTRLYDIKMIEDWDEQNLYLTLSLQEITNP